MSLSQTSGIGISRSELDDFVRSRIEEALPNHVLRAIARNILRKQLAEPTLEEAARLLKWKSPIALRRALERFGVELTKTSTRIVTVPISELRRFQRAHRVKVGSRKAKVRAGRADNLRIAA